MPAQARPADVDRVELLERTASVAYFAGANQRSVDLAREAIDSIDLAADPKRGARYYTLLSRNCWSIGDSEAAFDAYRRAAALLPADPPSAELARVMAEEARGLMLMSRLVEAEGRCHDAIATARATGARAVEGHAINTLGACRGCLGHYDEGIGLMREALVIAEELASPDDLNRAYGNLSSLLIDSGRLEEGAALVFDSAAVGEQLWGVRLNGAAGNSVDALVRLGRYDEAEALLSELGDHALGVCVPAPAVLPAPIAIRRGHFEEAQRLLARADQLTVALSDVQQRGTYHMLMAEAALEQGRPEDASEEIERGLALTVGTDDRTFGLEMRVLGVRALADRVEAAKTAGRQFDPNKARILGLELLQETQQVVEASAQRGPRTTALASTCAAEHSRLHRSDADLWKEAVSQWDLVREPYPAAYCRWREAEALLEGGTGRGRAGETLQLAWEAAAKMGAAPLKEKVERLAQRARIQLRQVSDAAPTDGSTLAADLGLTQREVEVLGQLASGRTDREIAEALFISKKTVSVHVSNLLRKLDVTNRVEAGRVGQAHGLSRPGPGPG
jgi:DNA-binding CsgD family transcriptional regulator